MKKLNYEERIFYLPNRSGGEKTFRGEPFASKEVYDLIGEDGIKFIDGKLNQLISQRSEMFGNGKLSYFGLSPDQRFFDIQNKTILSVKSIINTSDYTIQVSDEISAVLQEENESRESIINAIHSGILFNK